MDEHRAEPAAALAAEAPGGLLVPEGACSATRPWRPWHDNTAVRARRRVMRHFPHAALILEPPAALPVPIAPLALRVLAPPRQAVLVAPPGTTLRLTARALAALPGAVVVAAVAAGAENNLPMTPRAVEDAAKVLHRGGR